jgi:phosphofructokinase-like protein
MNVAPKTKDRRMKIGICTGGGDCPGLNAVIRGVVKFASQHPGMEIIGIRDALNGLIQRPIRAYPLTLDGVQDILHRGGTILGTCNQGGNPYESDQREENLRKTLEGVKILGLDALLVVGGEGTQGMAKTLVTQGIRVIGIPKTIDNDLPGTDQTIGFSSCVDVVADAVFRLRSTAESHDRVMVLEVMGRDSGYIALHGGIAGGAHAILIPEIPFSYEAVCATIQRRKKLGRNFSLVVVSEGAHEDAASPYYGGNTTGVKNLGGIGSIVARTLFEKTQMDTRYTVLGHLQRGGMPSAWDRILANQFAVHAMDLVLQKKFGNVVALQGATLTHVPYDEIDSFQRKKVNLTSDMIHTAEATGICLGR